MCAVEYAAYSNFGNRQAKHLPFDRTFGTGREAILYTDPTSSTFGAFHKALTKAAKEGSLSYRIRYRRTGTTPASTLPMSGYGVELALKKTDYIVIDDRSHEEEPHLESLSPSTGLDESEDLTDIKPLTASELSSLGVKAASFILQSEKPLETLIKLSQDLPKFLTSIVAHNVSTQFEEEFKSNSIDGVPDGVNVLWINGVQLIERQIEPFALIERLRQERKLINGFRALGLDGMQAVSILGHQDVSNTKDANEPLRYDWTDRLENGRVLLWLNDLENDDMYEDYPRSVTTVGYHRLDGLRLMLTFLVATTSISRTTTAYCKKYLYRCCTRRSLELRRYFICSTAVDIHFSGNLYQIRPCPSPFHT